MPRATEYQIGWEPLTLLLDDGLAGIITAHHAEIGGHKDRMPLNVDWGRYADLERQGILKVAAVRRDDELVGYSSFMVMPHLHYADTMHAMSDGIYVRPGMRSMAIRLIWWTERSLAALAAPRPVRIIYHAKMSNKFGEVLDRLGYKGFETLHDKMVGG